MPVINNGEGEIKVAQRGLVVNVRERWGNDGGTSQLHTVSWQQADFL